MEQPIATTATRIPRRSGGIGPVSATGITILDAPWASIGYAIVVAMMAFASIVSGAHASAPSPAPQGTGPFADQAPASAPTVLATVPPSVTAVTGAPDPSLPTAVPTTSATVAPTAPANSTPVATASVPTPAATPATSIASPVASATVVTVVPSPSAVASATVAIAGHAKADAPSPAPGIGPVETREPGRPIRSQAATVHTNGTTTWMSISAGYSHTCAITTNNQAYCWGYNGYGQLGDNTQDDSSKPVAVSGNFQWRQIVVAYRYTCGITTAGTAYCWGDNSLYQLGDNTPISRSVPTPVKSTIVWTKLAAGYQHVCGIASTGLGYCWGVNARGQLGDNTIVNKKVPVAVSGYNKWTTISTGDSHTCGVTDSYAAYCWGWNDFGQIGDGVTGTMIAPQTNKLVPTLVTGSKLWTSITASNYNTCGTDAAYMGYCWGRQSYIAYSVGNAFGNCYYTNSTASTCVSTPSLLSKTSPWKSIVVHIDTAFGFLTNNTLYQWGECPTNGCALIGNPNSTSTPYVPYLSYGQVFSSLSPGKDYSCGITTARTAYCWGQNDYGQLGDGTTTERYREVLVPDPPTITIPVSQNLRISNVRDGSATISWATSSSVTGSVVYGLASSGAGPSTPAYDSRGASTASTIHYVNITGLVPNTAYTFDLVSGNTTDTRSGQHYSFTTGPTLSVKSPDTVSGTVSIDGGGTPDAAIVYVSANYTDASTGNSVPCGAISAIVSSTNNSSSAWSLSIANLRTADNLAYCGYTTSSTLTIEAQAGSTGRAAVTKTVSEAKAATVTLAVQPVATVVTNLQSGWNLVALDGTLLVPMKASDICLALNAASAGAPMEVARWESGAWVSHICFLPMNDVTLSTGTGYFVKMASPATWTYDAIPTVTPKTLTMISGWNLISMSGAMGYDAAKTITGIEAAGGSNGSVIVCDEIDRWENGGWDPVIRASSANIFAIEGGRGYFVKLRKAVSWSPSPVAP